MSTPGLLANSHLLPETGELDFQLRTVRLRLVRRGKDLLVLDERPPKDAVGLFDWPEKEIDVELCRRYAFESVPNRVELRPLHPERPLLVRPRQPLALVPHSRVQFFVRFPLDLGIFVFTEDSEQFVERIRVEILSDTWFGDPVSGLFCYALRSRARRILPEDEAWEDGMGLCQLSIVNEGAEPLQCEKFCLDLKYCRLWSSGGHIWTSAISIRHQNAAQANPIHYSNEPPEQAVDAELAAEAVEVPARGFVGRTFAFAGLIGGS